MHSAPGPNMTLQERACMCQACYWQEWEKQCVSCSHHRACLCSHRKHSLQASAWNLKNIVITSSKWCIRWAGKLYLVGAHLGLRYPLVVLWGESGASLLLLNYVPTPRTYFQIASSDCILCYCNGTPYWVIIMNRNCFCYIILWQEVGDRKQDGKGKMCMCVFGISLFVKNTLTWEQLRLSLITP